MAFFIDNQTKILVLLSVSAFFSVTNAAGQEVPARSNVGASSESLDSGNGSQGLKFSFRYAPWKEVLDWFSTEAGYSLSIETPPSGTFNYTDSRLYTPAESIDLLNSVLLVKGYTLVRRQRMLMLINLEDGIPPNLISNVKPEDLDSLGEFELVSCTFQLQRMTPEEADEEINKLKGPQGEVIVLSKARQVMVTETAGKLRVIRDMINAVEAPEEIGSAAISQLPLEHISPDEALLVIRQIMGIEEDRFSTEDEQLKLSVDALGTRLIAKATPDALAEIRDVLKLIDVPVTTTSEGGGVVEAPQLEVYPISNADSGAVYDVMQTLLAGLPDVRISIDPETDNLIVLARTPQHKTIKATLEQLQSQYDQIEVIPINYLDPTTAKLAVESLFGIDPDSEEPQKGPRVDVNTTTSQLLVRGSEEEIQRIRALLKKMGEDGETTAAEKGNVRMIPMSGASAQALMERIQGVWPTVRGNQIRVVSPSTAIGTMRSAREERENQQPPDDLRPNERGSFPDQGSGSGDRFRAPQRDSNETQNRRAPADFDVGVPSRNARRVTYLAQAEEGFLGETDVRDAVDDPSNLPEVVVAPGPGGLLIASDDLEALDAFEELATALSDPALFPDNDYSVFYLKYAKAEVASQLLNDLISGTDSGAADSLAGAAFGSLLDAAADALDTSGPLQIVPDGRINALIVRGQAADVETIRQLLLVLDQEHSPEDVQTQAKPRLIGVYNSSASDIANVVKEIYAKRIQGSGGAAAGGRGGQPNMEQIMAAMRGGRGGRGGGQTGGGAGAQVEPDLTVGVDSRSNSLIVSAPDPLFQEIKELVAELDAVAISSNEVTKVVTVTKSNPDAIQKALGSLFGAQVTGGSSGGNATSGNSSAKSSSQDRGQDKAAQEAMQRRLEFFNALRRGGAGGGRGGRGGDGGGRGGAGGGRGGGGERGGGGRGGR